MLLRSGLLAVGLGLGARAAVPTSALVRPRCAPSSGSIVGASLRTLNTDAAFRPRHSSVLAELRRSQPGASVGLGMSSSRSSVLPPRFLAARPFTSSPSLLQRLGRIKPRRIAIPIQGAAEAGTLPEQSIWTPILFSIVFTLLAFTLAAWYTNQETAYWLSQVRTYSLFTPSNGEINRAKRLSMASEAQQSVERLKDTLSFLPTFVAVPIMRTYIMMKEWQLNQPASSRAPVLLLGVMIPVFLAWQVRRFQPFMRKWFTHFPIVFPGGEARSCITMLTSTISHKDLWHFAFNGIALLSFGNAAYVYLAQNEYALPTCDDVPQFIAFFAVAGLAASLGSHLFTNIVRLPRLMRALLSPARLSPANALAAHNAILPSLGASGAIYAMLSVVALAFPNSHVNIIFLPFFQIPIGLGVAGMICLDVVGIIRGWKMFDHVAHFCGAMFGIFYFYVGKEWYNWLRTQLGAVKRTWR